MRIGFDIGGVISRYPTQIKALMAALGAAGHDIFVVTDMSPADALRACQENGVPVAPENIISCDWAAHGDLCKAHRLREHGVDIMIDDRLDYIHEGAPISLLVVPRPDTPYYHPDWKNTASLTVCVPEEEYELFKQWRDQR